MKDALRMLHSQEITRRDFILIRSPQTLTKQPNAATLGYIFTCEVAATLGTPPR